MVFFGLRRYVCVWVCRLHHDFLFIVHVYCVCGVGNMFKFNSFNWCTSFYQHTREREQKNSVRSYHYRIIYSQITPRPTKHTERTESRKKTSAHTHAHKQYDCGIFFLLSFVYAEKIVQFAQFLTKCSDQKTLLKFSLNNDVLLRYSNWNGFELHEICRGNSWKFRYSKMIHHLWSMLKKAQLFQIASGMLANIICA